MANNPGDPNNPNQPAGLGVANQSGDISEEQIIRLKNARKEYESLNDIKKKFGDSTNEIISQLEQEEAKLLSANRAAKGLTSEYQSLKDSLDASIKSREREIEQISSELTRAIREQRNAAEELIAIQEKQRELDKDGLDLADRIVKGQVTANEAIKKATDNLQDNNEAREEFSKILRDIDNRTQNSILTDNEKLEIIKKLTKLIGDESQARNILNGIEEANLQIFKENLPNIEKEIKLREDNAAAAKTEAAAKVALAESENQANKAMKDVNGALDSHIKKMFGAGSSNSFFTNLVVANSGKQGGVIKNMLGQVADSFLSPQNSMNLFFGFLDKFLIKSTFEFDKNLAQINKDLGGMGKEFEQVATSGTIFKSSAVSNLAPYGVGLKEFGAAYTALAKQMNGFNNMTEDQRRLLTANAAALETLGISASNYAKMASTLMGSLGKSADEANKVINNLAKDAMGAGRDVGEYAKEFEKLMPKLVAYGREATQIFKELNSFAAMTKGVMSTGDLEEFAEQFNNWDTAAESVSKLNAALGGTSINIADMMRADPSERLMMLKQAFDQSGQSFDNLNAGYKRLLAESFGGDVAKAAAFFNGSLQEANRLMQKNAASEKEAEERKKKSVDAQTKLNKAIEGMQIALTPILSVIGAIAEGISWMNDHFTGLGTFLMVGIPLAYLALRGATKLLGITLRQVFSEVFTHVRFEIGETTAKINMAAVQASQIPKGGAVGGFMGAAGKLSTGAKVMGGLAVVGAVGGMASTMSSWNTGPTSTQGIAVNNPNQNNTSGSPVPFLGAGNIETNTTLYKIDQSTGQLVAVAQPAANDEFLQVEASTPEEQARKQIKTMEPIISSVRSMSDRIKETSYTNNESINNKVKEYSKDLKESYSSSKEYSSKEQAIAISNSIKESIGELKINTNVQIPKGALVATLREKDAEQLIERSAALAVATSAADPNRKISSMLPGVTV